MAKLLELKKTGNVKRKIITAALLICIAGLVALVYINRYNPILSRFFNIVTQMDMANKRGSVALDSAYKNKIEIYRDNLLICSNDGVRVVNVNGNEVWNLNIALSDPLVSVAGRYALVADRFGSNAWLILNNSVAAEVSVDDRIQDIAVNEQGVFALVCEETGYKGQIMVYDNKGVLIYHWHSGENSIIDVDISRDGTRMAVATLDLNAGTASGGILFFNFALEKPFAGNISEGNLIAGIRYNGDGSLIAVGDVAAIKYSAKGEELWRINYAGRTLQAFDIDMDDNYVFGFSLGGVSNTVVEAYNRSGRLKGGSEAGDEIKYIHQSGALIVYNYRRDVVVTNQRGQILAQALSSRDVRDVIIYPDNKHIIILSSMSADIVALN